MQYLVRRRIVRPIEIPGLLAEARWRESFSRGRYRIERRLGAGAAGRVYAARDRDLDRDVAVKVLARSGSEVARKRSRSLPARWALVRCPPMDPLVEACLLDLPADLELHPNAFVGYRPGRRIAELRLVLGPGAVVRSGSVIYAGSRIGARLQTGHGVVIREECEIGDDFNVWNSTTIDYGCTIGDGVKVHCGGYVAQYTTLEDGVFLAPGVITANDPHPLCGKCLKGPTVKRMARIGVNATLLPRITIGESALVGSGAVVTKDVPDRAVVVGNPARVVGRVEDLECKVGLVEKPYPLPPAGD